MMKVSEAYKNIENIISKGFLSELVEYGNVKIVLKNITDKEFEMLPYYSGTNREQYSFYQLAFATYMINGVSYLKRRSQSIEKLADFYRDLPAPFFSVLLLVLEDLHVNYLESSNYLEGYSYTDASRYMWNSLNNNLFVINPYGIEGIEAIGVNSIQENWILINKQLDREESYRTQFHLSVLIASSLNGKGAKTLTNNFETKEKDIREYRELISRYGCDKNRKQEERKQEWAPQLRTREDLVQELERQMRGEKDKHDLFMEKWYEQQKQRASAAKNRAIEKHREFKKKFDEDILDLEPTRVATEEEIKKITKPVKYPGASVSHDEYRKKDDDKRFLSKMSSNIIKAKDIKR